MAATAVKDNWKPTSNSQQGLYNSIQKAVTISVFADNGFSVCSDDSAKIENITTERTTEGDSPVRKANPHRSDTIIKSSKGFKL